MTREGAINKLNWALDNNMIEDVQNAYDYIMAIKMAIEALEQEPCDAISRQAAIDTIESWLSCDDYNEAERYIMRATQSVLHDLPPVTPHYTDTEIQKMQEMEQAEIQKAYELGRTSQPKTAEQKGDFSSEQI